MKNICKTIFVVMGFLLSGSLWAADPIIGTWKLNIEKSKLPLSISTQESRMEVYRELDSGDIELTLTTTSSDGTSEVRKLIWPAQGGIAREEDSEGRLVIETLIAPGDWCATQMQDGKQTTVIHKVVSKDRKTMQQTFKVVPEQGVPIEGVGLYDRQ